MGEEKRQANNVASDRTSCCGPAIEQKMRAFFATMGSEAENDTGSCADRMAEMMEACCGPFSRRDKPARDDQSEETKEGETAAGLQQMGSTSPPRPADQEHECRPQ